MNTVDAVLGQQPPTFTVPVEADPDTITDRAVQRSKIMQGECELAISVDTAEELYRRLEQHAWLMLLKSIVYLEPQASAWEFSMADGDLLREFCAYLERLAQRTGTEGRFDMALENPPHAVSLVVYPPPRAGMT